ncbi:unnamed protein product, partial [Discosporangium mesarthrocarpum]
QASGKSPKEIPISFKTRWWSYYYMLSALLEYRYEVMSTSEAANQRWGPSINIRGADWDNAEEMCKMLGPFAETVELTEGDKYITLSYIPSLMEGLNAAILDASSTLPEDGALLHAGDDLFDDHSDRWKELNTPTKVATMVDPRTKDGAWMEPPSTMLALNCRPGQSGGYATASASSAGGGGGGGSVAVPVPSAAGQGGGSAALLTAEQRTAMVEAEIARFRATPGLLLDASGDDVLAWWAKHQHGFPYLARLAVVHLATPATSATSARVFLAAGSTVAKKRNRLGSEMIDALVVRH